MADLLLLCVEENLILDSLIDKNFIIINTNSNTGEIIVTDKGHNELERLTKLAGLPTFEQIEKI